MRLSISLVMCGLVLLSAGAAHGEGQAELRPDLPCQAKLSNPVTYDVEMVVAVTAPYHTKLLKVWLPLPPSDLSQEVSGREISTFPADVKPRIGKEKLFGNEFAYFEFPHPEGAQLIRHKFKIKVSELNWNVDPKKAAAPAKWPEAFAPYLRSEDQAVVINDRARKLAGEIVPRSQGMVSDVDAVFGWVSGHMKYDHAKASLQASSEHALKLGCGHCSDYHGLCASLNRSLGYPSRVTYGINAFPKNSPSHCKVEVFLPSYGWVSFDVSETQKLVETIKKSSGLDEAKKKELTAAAQRRFSRGFRDNTWYLQTRGTDYELEPKASRRVAVVRTIFAEADGQPLPEPDPANPAKQEHSWMTAQKFTPDKKVAYPFSDWKGLEQK